MGALNLEELRLRIEQDFDFRIENYIDSKFRVLSTGYYEKPIPVIEIYDQEKDSWDVFATLGNISTVKGKAKSRKSTLLSLIVASAVCGEEIQGKIRSNLPKGKQNVLYIDSEQQLHHVSFILHRVKMLTKLHNVDDKLFMYCLRQLSPKERVLKVKEYVESIPNLGLVIIDGIRDLVMSINNEEESTEIVTLLMKWSLEYDVHIINVLHENPTSEKARGHIGTEMMNKSETVIKVEVDSKNDDISGIYPDMCRNKPFKAFPIGIDDSGIPFISEQDLANKTPRKLGVKDLNGNQIANLIDNAFKGNKELNYSELLIQLQSHFNILYGNSIGDNQAKQLIKSAKEMGVINQPEGNRKPFVQVKFEF